MWWISRISNKAHIGDHHITANYLTIKNSSCHLRSHALTISSAIKDGVDMKS